MSEEKGGIHFTSDGDTMWLECFSDHPDADRGQIIEPVEPGGSSWDAIAEVVRQHQAEHGCAPEPQPAHTFTTECDGFHPVGEQCNLPAEPDTRAETLAQVAHRAYWVTLLRGVEPTDAYDDEEAEYQRAWIAAAAAVAAHVANPTAADFDNAAEIMRLRDRLEVFRELALELDAEADNLGGGVGFVTRHEIAERIRRRLDAQPQPAPELAAAMAETRELRELVTDMLTAFTVTGSGHSARVGQVQIAKWRKRAGLPE